MSDKKIIFIALLLAFVLVIGGWAYTKSKPNPGPAAISGSHGQKTGGITVGDENAVLTIEEYTNFLCPACANFALNTLPKIQEEYIKTGKVKMVFYIFPPLELAEAAFCAEESNKFTEFHDYVFAHQEEIISEEVIFSLISEIGLEENQFSQCYNKDQALSVAQGWFEEGKERGVDATPTFFIGGEKIVGTKSFEEFKKIIDDKLE